MAQMLIKEVKPILVAALRKQGSVKGTGKAFEELYGSLVRLKAPLAKAAPIGIYFSGEDFDPENTTFEVCVPLAAEVEGAGFEVKELPAAKMTAAIHQGPYETIGPLYTEMFQWLEQNGWKLAGPVREVYLVAPGPGGAKRPRDYVTEVQLPVAEA